MRKEAQLFWGIEIFDFTIIDILSILVVYACFRISCPNTTRASKKMFNDLSGMGIPDHLMNLVSCHGFENQQ